MIRETMRWRKINLWDLSEGDVKDYHFPIEFFLVSTLFAYEPDKNNYMTLYIRIAMHRKVKELEKFTKAFFLHTYDKVDRASGQQGIALIFDLTNAGYRNLDLDYLRFLIDYGVKYCPVGVKYIVVLNIPWTLNAFRKMVFSFLSKEWFNVLKFANGKEILNYIDEENLPDYLGGKCRRNYRSVPRGAQPIENLVEKYGYSHADVTRIMPVYKDALDEASVCLAKNDYIDKPGWLDNLDPTEHPRVCSEAHDGKTKSNDHDLDENFNSIQGSISVYTLLPNNCIYFTHSADEKLRIRGQVMINNGMQSPVAFKILANNPENYSVSPSYGIVKSSSGVKIDIAVKDMAKCRSNDRFKIIAIPVSKEEMKESDFINLWNVENLFWAKLGINFDQQIVLDHANDSLVGIKDLKDGMMELVRSTSSLDRQQRRIWFLLYLLLFLYLFLVGRIFLRSISTSIHQSFSDLTKISSLWELRQ